jgi:hypothetical protein
LLRNNLPKVSKSLEGCARYPSVFSGILSRFLAANKFAEYIFFHFFNQIFTMKNSITQSFLWLFFAAASILQGFAQATCTNFPVPEVTVVNPTSVSLGTLTITNLPAGASSSIGGAFTVGQTVYTHPSNSAAIYTVKMQLNGCISEKRVMIQSRFGLPKYPTGCIRIVNKGTGKVLEAQPDGTVRQVVPNGNINQAWELFILNIAGPYSYKSKSTGKLLSVDCTTGALMQQTPPEFPLEFTSSQQWNILQYPSDTTERIMNCGKSLRADSNTANIGLAVFDTINYFKWKYEQVTCPTPTTCAKPNRPSLIDLNNNTVIFNWNNVPNAISYDWKITRPNNVDVQSGSTLDSFARGLLPIPAPGESSLNGVDIVVRTRCASGVSEWSDPLWAFKTCADNRWQCRPVFFAIQ